MSTKLSDGSGISFSVVTVVLNDITGLKKTYLSLVEQSYKNYEWIVKDGGSNDEIVRFLMWVPGKVKWVSEKDRGIYDAMNQGISMSEGEFVVFMNAGDTFCDSESLATVSRQFLLNSQLADVLYGGAMLSFSEGVRMVYRPPRMVEKYLWHGLPANHQATYYRRSLLKKIPYNLQYSLCGDYYLAASLTRNGSCAAYIDEPLAIFEVGGQSYKRLWQIFAEPYRIQRDVLGSPWYYRLASVLKRLVSTLGFVVLSQTYLFKK